MSVEVIPEFESLPESWDLRPLADLVSEDRKISYGIVQPGFHDDSGVPIIRVNNIRQNRIVADDVMRVSAEIESQYKRTRIQGGELLVTLVGSLGEVAIADDKYRGWNLARAVGVVPIADPAIAEWVKFYFGSRIAKYFIGMWANTTVQHTLNLKDLAQLPVPLPPTGERQELIELIGSLDEKIELNRKQNRTLEAIAQALFKRWFVEFEFPDENGRPYQSSGGAMQPSELGEVPVGWRTGKLEVLLGELETGSRPKGGVGMFTDGIPSIGAESITRIGEYDYGKTKYVTEEYFSKMRRGVIKDRDVLIYKDGGTPGRFDVRISMFGGGFPFESACINEHVFRVQAKKPVYQNYLYLWFSSYPVLEELRHRGAKAAIPGINLNDVKERDFLFMNEVVLEKFDEVIEPLFAKLLRNSREMAVLARLRDALLPRLMSGELRVA